MDRDAPENFRNKKDDITLTWRNLIRQKTREKM